MSDKLPDKTAGRGEIAAFVKQATIARVKARQPLARLLFALDATASRQPTWDTACQLQADMFTAAAALSGISIQLCYYRGFDEFSALPWLDDSRQLQRAMSAVQCRAGHTQLQRVLQHALAEHRRAPVRALVFVGDALEENLDTLAGLAGQLGLAGLQVFLFQEGHDPVAARGFADIARLTRGVHLQFSHNSARELRELLSAVAAYAAGGRQALERQAPSRLRDAMMRQLPPGRPPPGRPPPGRPQPGSD